MNKGEVNDLRLPLPSTVQFNQHQTSNKFGTVCSPHYSDHLVELIRVPPMSQNQQATKLTQKRSTGGLVTVKNISKTAVLLPCRQF